MITKTLCFLLCIAYATCFYVDNASLSKDKIVGGDFVKIEDVPYQASLMWYHAVNLCGATIIHESWILTAAHCVENKTNIAVRTGTGYRIALGTTHDVKQIIMHPDYDTKNTDNDIALIELKEPIKITAEQKPIPIAKSNNIPLEGQIMKISGFGKIGERLSTSSILKAADVSVMNEAKCTLAYKRDPITDNMFCAGDGSTDACQGDSGGPGVINGKLYGVVSSGIKCGSSKYPGVYTKVYKYYSWIVDTTGIDF